MRIRRHDALVNILHHALLQDHILHLAIVEKAGGDFIPLVVEGFGIWTPFALSVLHSIADHTTTAFYLKWPEEIYFNNFLFVYG